LRFQHLLEETRLAEQLLQAVNAHLTQPGLILKQGTTGSATLIAAPSSTKNQSGERDPPNSKLENGVESV
jgi:IS5 family transposase